MNHVNDRVDAWISQQSTGSDLSRVTSAPNAVASDKLQLPASCDPPSESNLPRPAVWIIFGATGHIGRSLARAALEHGDQVTAVGRDGESTLQQMRDWHESCLGLLCDVRVRETVEAVITRTVSTFGRIDVIANCTGYGVVAAAEDQTSSDLHNQFSINFFGTLNILATSLPYFRSNEIPGRYLIFSSTAGALGVPGLAPYCASKYAVEGLIESMLYEVDGFGIKATLVEPGHVRLEDRQAFTDASQPLTDVPQRPRSSSLQKTSTPTRFGHFHIQGHTSAAYDTTTSPSGHAKRTFIWFDKRQPTSAARSAELVWQLGHCSYPPLRLLLGNYAVESVRDRLRCVIEEIEEWRWLNFPGEEGDDGGGARQSIKQEADDDSMRDYGHEEEEDGDGDGDEDGDGDGSADY